MVSIVNLFVYLIHDISIIKQDIVNNRSIKDALVAEEKFFRSRPVCYLYLWFLCFFDSVFGLKFRHTLLLISPLILLDLSGVQ